MLKSQKLLIPRSISEQWENTKVLKPKPADQIDLTMNRSWSQFFICENRLFKESEWTYWTTVQLGKSCEPWANSTGSNNWLYFKKWKLGSMGCRTQDLILIYYYFYFLLTRFIISQLIISLLSQFIKYLLNLFSLLNLLVI